MYRPKDYWASLAERRDSVDDAGFAPVLHPLSPFWFNQLIDDLQFRAIRRALAMAAVPRGALFLDVGCGTGRWVRRYEELGFSPVGVDATVQMLQIARTRRTGAPLLVGLAQCLPFADSAFDCLSDITVVQHIPYELQSGAFREMVRVIKPGGRLILMEVICGKAPNIGRDSHVFPREPRNWIDEVENLGASLIGWFGQEFLVADRLYVGLAQVLFGRKGSLVGKVLSDSYKSIATEPSLTRRVYWKMRYITAHISAWSEPSVARILPRLLATHGVFVFRKKE